VNYTAVGATEAFFSLPCCAAIPIIAVSSFAMKGDEEMARAVRWLARRLIHHSAYLTYCSANAVALTDLLVERSENHRRTVAQQRRPSNANEN
jgi:hypothetical protein